ncbi:TetR/AcrR family transcriptional regulator [Pseudooceanicola sp.]|uniref:TetR/AcrR family transcriptional regulator n=1 Tax=Pseudooceanicola sp. TaxID=1914328 RepID=UPI0035C7019E
MSESRERKGQKLRTREAILRAARELLSEGQAITVIAAAERAGVSKATAYRYYSDPALLAAEAGLDVSVLPYDKVVAGAEDVRAKLLAISLYFFDLAIAHEAEFRTFLGLTLAAEISASTAPGARRGGRRVSMYFKALEGVGDRLDEVQKAALVRALSMATGAEAMIGLYDVVGVEHDPARATVAEVAEAIIDRFLPGA